MEAEIRDLVEFLVDEEAIRFGTFVLKSGGSSPFFIDIGQISSASAFDFLGGRFAAKLQSSFPTVTHLFGPAYKGISLATATALAFKRRTGKDIGVIFERKEAKIHGEGGMFIGKRPFPGDVVVVIDDVITNGETKIATANLLEKHFDTRPAGTLVCIDRRVSVENLGFDVQALASIRDVAAVLLEMGHPEACRVHQFLEGKSL